MLDLGPGTWLFLVVAAFTGGWINAVAGGGGLVQLPAVLLAFPEAATLTAIGTNKVASVTGTTVTTVTYVRAHKPDWQLALRIMGTTFATALVGALLITRISTDFLRPAVFVVLLGVWLFTIFRKPVTEHEVFATPRRGRALLIAAVVGLYDGMVGPGTGAFLLIGYVAFVGLSFLGASVLAKMTNGMSNLASVFVLGVLGYVHWWLAAGLAVANAAGGVLGARMAIDRGSAFVRLVFLLTTGPLILRFGWSLFA